MIQKREVKRLLFFCYFFTILVLLSYYLANTNQQVMKKYITLFTFVCVLFLGMQAATAQESPEAKAKTKTLELSKAVELSDAQVQQVYAIYLAYEKNNRVENAAALDKARKDISALLHPEQQQQFKARFVKEKERKKKLAKGRAQ